MNVEFHYYAIHALALEAGFDADTARIMASASQYVDTSTTALAFDAPQGRVDVAVTQNYVFWDDSVRRDIYLPFHFLPGEPQVSSALRKDGASNPYAVTANSTLAKELLVGAFRDKDPYIMGVALHAFADTWAHQNFAAQSASWNELDSGMSALGLPAAGHLHALSAPDEPDRTWTDSRLVPAKRTVVNTRRFADAARKIFRYFRVFLGKPFDDDDLVVERLASIWADPSRDGRLAEYCIRYDLGPWDAQSWRLAAGAPPDRSPLAGVRHYDKLAWAKAELARALRGGLKAIPVSSSLYQSELYQWHQAATEYRLRAQAALAKRGLL
ncbi:MAG: hypothetical protein KBB32_08120 [Spirochaetia bacterium]|nr:hypothetical protein [Spirochaetia bacterium]